MVRKSALPYMIAGMLSVAFVSFLGFYWAYLGRVALVDAQRQSCRETVTDRRSDILVRATQAWATQQVADDPRQPPRTRRVRGVEAAQDRMSVRDRLTRVDSPTVAAIIRDAKTAQVWRLILRLDTGRRLDCAVEHPAATVIP